LSPVLIVRSPPRPIRLRLLDSFPRSSSEFIVHPPPRLIVHSSPVLVVSSNHNLLIQSVAAQSQLLDTMKPQSFLSRDTRHKVPEFEMPEFYLSDEAEFPIFYQRTMTILGGLRKRNNTLTWAYILSELPNKYIMHVMAGRTIK
jgi:hypothetical protein